MLTEWITLTAAVMGVLGVPGALAAVFLLVPRSVVLVFVREGGVSCGGAPVEMDGQPSRVRLSDDGVCRIRVPRGRRHVSGVIMLDRPVYFMTPLGTASVVRVIVDS